MELYGNLTQTYGRKDALLQNTCFAKTEGSDVELRTLRTNQQNSDQKTILKGLNAHYQTNFKFLFVSEVRRMGSSTFVPETILRHKQTDRTCWTIQTRSDELN